MYRTFLSPAVLLALAASSPSLAQQNLLVNGSFEQGTPLTGGWTSLAPGSVALPGWTVVRSTIDLVGTYWQQCDGQRSLDLDGTPGNGGVEQSFATTPGERYQVAFRMAGNCFGLPLIKTLVVSAAGASASFAFDISGHTLQDMGWRDYSWSFVATSTTTTLSLLSGSASPNYCGPALDDVRVFPDRYLTYGASCAGNLAVAPTLAEASGSSPVLGTRYFLEIRDVPVGGIAVALLGWRQPVALDLTLVGAPGCTAEVVILSLDIPPAPVAGLVTWGIDIPNRPELVGVGVDEQIAILKSGVNVLGIITTNGGRFLIR